MTRQVPLDQPLSEEDRAYLHARGEHATVERLDAQFGDGEQETGADVVPETEDDYDEWTVQELQGEAGKRQLPKSGNKEQLIERLRAWDKEQQS